MQYEYVDDDEAVTAAEDEEPFMEVTSKKAKKQIKKKAKDSIPAQEIKLLQAIEPEGINKLDSLGEWEEIELAVDSGATETVINEDMIRSVEMKEGPASRRGVEYEVANGVRIPNLGEKKFVGISEEGAERNITAQVCDVNKALLSVKKILTAGNRVVFDESGSYIEDKGTGDKMWMKEVNGMYMLKMWVRAQRVF